MQETIDVFFKVNYITQFGRSLYICGNVKEMGNWNPLNAFKLKYSEGHWWSGLVKIQRNQAYPVEYKFIVNNSEASLDNVIWENGENRLIELTVLNKMTKNEYFILEKWSLRTLKFKLRYNLDSKNESMYIVGSLAQLGSWHTPMKMNCVLKTIGKQQNDQKQQSWTFLLDVDPTNFWVRYYYVIKNEKSNAMIWERGPGRVVQSSDFKQQLQQRTDNELKQHQKNGTFIQMDKKPKHYYYQSQSNYDYQNQAFSFQYYVSFGRFNIEDANFDTHFLCEEVNNNILIGPYPQDQNDILKLKSMNIKAVLNLQTQYDINLRGIQQNELQNYFNQYHIEQLKFEILDMNVDDFLKKGIQAAKLLKKLIDKYERVYVHCTCGIGRAPSTVVLYLIIYQNYTVEEAIKFVKNKRPAFFINYNMIASAAMKSLGN